MMDATRKAACTMDCVGVVYGAFDTGNSINLLEYIQSDFACLVIDIVLPGGRNDMERTEYQTL